MAQKITKGIKDLVAEASADIKTISVDEADAMRERDDVMIIDIRDVRELAKTGRIPGAKHVPRGMLEFWVAPDSPYYKEFFNDDKTFVFYCASAMRSALATKAVQDMGLKPVAHIAGGFTAWEKAGKPIEAPKAPKEGS